MAKDPYRYFRIEAAELIDGLGQGVLALEKDGGGGAVARLLRLAHTLKGAARVVRQGAIADAAHELEELLVPLRTQARAAVQAEIERCLALVDRMRDELGALDRTRPAGADEPAAPAAEPLRAVRTDSSETDALVEGLASASRALAELSLDLDALESVRSVALKLAGMLDPHRQLSRAEAQAAGDQADGLGERLRRSQRELSARVERLQRELSEMRSRVERMRLQPLSMLFGPLERVLRDAARELERQVRWESSGGEIGVDSAVLALLAETLPHVVRNAVAHGIEPASARLDAGKPAQGVVRLHCSRRGNRITITLSDDGRGLDFGAIRAVALQRGLLGAGQAVGDTELTALLLRGGLSTSATVTRVAGRGVGLDAVRAAVDGLRGALALGSRPGLGTTLEIEVPASLASAPALITQAGGSVVAIPLEAVLRTLRVPQQEIVRSAAGAAIAFEQRTVPLLPLAQLVGAAAARTDRRHCTTVVLRAGEAEAALEVDRLIGTAEVTVRPFPAGVRPVAALAGAGVDDAGAPRLVLDAAAAVSEVRSWRGGTASAAAKPAAPTLPILVIDDSLTTRTLEQSILESAGYEVDIAVSAEQGLEMAGARRYGLFVVDVEMPGIDGFEFVARTRADPALRLVPAILVTSRADADDRRRGRESGASAYIVKAEFDQRHLLDLISGLLG